MAQIPVQEILGLIQNAEMYRPVVQGVLNAAKSYGPELKDLLSTINNGLVDLRIEAIARYQAAGFTREEAILMSINTSHALSEAIKINNRSNGK